MIYLIKASEEAQTIQYLVVGDPRGRKLLRKYYGSPIYGMITRMRSCPIQSADLLESTFSKIQNDIGRFSGNLSFFTWIMQVARNLSIGYGEVTATPTDQLDGTSETAFSLVMHRGFTLAQAAVILGVGMPQVSKNLRIGIKQARNEHI